MPGTKETITGRECKGNEAARPLILHVVSGDLWGGAEAQVLLQCRALQPAWNLAVLTFNDKDVYRSYREAGLQVFCIAEERGWIVLIKESLALLKRAKPHILVAHGYKEAFLCGILSLLTGIPWVSTFHGLTENYRGWAEVKVRLYCSVQRFLSRSSAAAIVCVSEKLSKDLGLRGCTKVRVVRNSADFTADVLRIDLARPAIVAAGRLVPVKRVDLALAAVERLRQGGLEVHLYVLGEGPEEEKLKEQARAAAIEDLVHFLGFRRDAVQYIASADLLLLTSDSEGIPTVLLEAAAHAVPVVSTAVGGIPEVTALFPGYPSILVSPGDVQAAADGIRQVLHIDRRSFNKEAMLSAFRQNFAPAVAAEKLTAIYREILERT